MSRCACCGAACPALSVCGAFLCDAHFDAWLALPVTSLPGVERMAAFVAAKSMRARGGR